MFATETITSMDLLQMLSDVKSTERVSIVTETMPPVKAGSPVVVKRSEVVGDIDGPKKNESLNGGEYERAVNAQRAREGTEPDFKGEHLPWGVRLKDTCLIVNNDSKTGQIRAYLRIRIHSTKSPKYFINGAEVTAEEAAKYLRPRSSSSRQGTSKEVIVRNYQVTPKNCTVKGISINKKSYLVQD